MVVAAVVVGCIVDADFGIWNQSFDLRSLHCSLWNQNHGYYYCHVVVKTTLLTKALADWFILRFILFSVKSNSYFEFASYFFLELRKKKKKKKKRKEKKTRRTVQIYNNIQIMKKKKK